MHDKGDEMEFGIGSRSGSGSGRNTVNMIGSDENGIDGEISISSTLRMEMSAS